MPTYDLKEDGVEGARDATHATPLTEAEQDDLFRQMEKRLSKVGVQPTNLLACEMENMYRMRATILQQRKALEWARKSIQAYERKEIAT